MKRIVFVTGTRADFGKLKSLIKICQSDAQIETYVFITGMHTNPQFGHTAMEVYKSNIKNTFEFINHTAETPMDMILANTIGGFSAYLQCKEVKPDLIVIHGDRIEALACSIVGALNNILVAHIEGGELSGSIDESIRHSISKLSHIHLTCNEESRKRLLQMGEKNESIHIIGSPDIDYMQTNQLANIEAIKKKYDIAFDQYIISLYHPVTSEKSVNKLNAIKYYNALKSSPYNFVIIYPNNDFGYIDIVAQIKEIQKENPEKFRCLPSMRFEAFLSLLYHSKMMVGNSSSGIREAPYFGLPTVDVGSRQKNRGKSASVMHTSNETSAILNGIMSQYNKKFPIQKNLFGDGSSSKKFYDLIKKGEIFNTSTQKIFQNL